MTYQVREYQIQDCKVRFNGFLRESKKKIISEMVEMMKESECLEDFEGVKRRVSESIERFYESTRNNVWGLAGEVECE